MSVSTLRLWLGSRCTSSRSSPAAAAISATTSGRRPSLTLTTHSQVESMPVNLSPFELLLILGVLLLLFGATKLPKLARSLGQAQGEFKKGLSEGRVSDAADDPDVAPKPDDSPTTS
jgi:sec-independent protein translocase protein TatA